MTHITFDDIVNPSKKPFTNITNRFINGFLSMHDGPIHEFNLSVDESDGRDLDKWLLRACLKDVRELDIRGRGPFIKAPPRIFSCKKLTSLKLAWCILKPPPSFEGFLRMKHLVLFCVSSPREDMERLISSCPLLEDLTLDDSLDSELTVRSPNLKCLNLKGRFGDICLENTPLLADVTVAPNEDGYLDFGCYYRYSSSYVYLGNLLGGVPKLERLCGESYFMRCLSAWELGWKFITYEFLKHIELSSVGLDNLKEVLVLLQMIFSSPNLQELYVQGRATIKFKTDGEFSWDWFEDHLLAYRGTLNRLELVEINGTIQDHLVLTELIKFLLNRSPSLVMMRIDTQLSRSRCTNHIRKTTQMMVEQLSNFPRASPKASVVLFPE